MQPNCFLKQTLIQSERTVRREIFIVRLVKSRSQYFVYWRGFLDDMAEKDPSECRTSIDSVFAITKYNLF